MKWVSVGHCPYQIERITYAAYEYVCGTHTYHILLTICNRFQCLLRLHWHYMVCMCLFVFVCLCVFREWWECNLDISHSDFWRRAVTVKTKTSQTFINRLGLHQWTWAWHRVQTYLTQWLLLIIVFIVSPHFRILPFPFWPVYFGRATIDDRHFICHSMSISIFLCSFVHLIAIPFRFFGNFIHSHIQFFSSFVRISQF